MAAVMLVEPFLHRLLDGVFDEHWDSDIVLPKPEVPCVADALFG